MTSQNKAWILDVGHGNATVVEDSDYVCVIDGGRGDTLLRFLRDRQIRRIDTVIVTHADADHFGGVSLLLLDPEFTVGQVFINPDPRRTRLWSDFRAVMGDAKERGTVFRFELTRAQPGEVIARRTRLEILAPAQEFAYTTPAGRAAGGRQLNANAMSAVVRVWSGDSPRLLIAGDIDQLGLDNLLRGKHDISAGVLLFPHHGGLPGGANAAAFAESLVTAVGADLIVFSIGRGQHGTPRPEIVAAALRATDDVHIACTQLSERCAADLPTVGAELHAGIARGAASHACCAGTIEVSLDQERTYVPRRSAHLEFVSRYAPTALCRMGGA